MKDIIQVAGVIDIHEALMLADAGIEYMGFPLRLPVNAVDHSEEEAAKIISSLPSPAKAVLITYQNEAGDIISFCDKMGATIIQLHGDIAVSELKKLKTLRPDIIVIKSLVVGERSVEELNFLMDDLSPWADAFITDTYDPETGASGATGMTHNWEISAGFVEHSLRPVILAGGLNADNVREAIKTVKPAGVDVHTGIEDEDGRKSPDKLKKFIDEVKAGFKAVQ